MNRDELIEHLREEIAKLDMKIGEIENDVSYYAARNEELRAELAAINVQAVEMTYTPHGDGSTGCASPADGRIMPNANYGLQVTAALHVRPTCASFYDEIMEVLGEETK